MIAKRRRPGTISRKSASRFAAISVDWIDKPVTLPPGRARLATRPVPIGSAAIANTIGMTVVACLDAITAGVDDVTMNINLESHEFGCNFGEALATSFCPPIFDRHGAAFDPSQLAQPLNKSGGSFALVQRSALAQESDSPQLASLLRSHRDRPYRRAAEQRDELASS